MAADVLREGLVRVDEDHEPLVADHVQHDEPEEKPRGGNAIGKLNPWAGLKLDKIKEL